MGPLGKIFPVVALVTALERGPLERRVKKGTLLGAVGGTLKGTR